VVAAVEKSLGKGRLSKLDGKEWHGLLVRFLEDFDGVPAREAFARARAADLSAHAKVADKALGEIRANRDKDRAKAALAAADLLESGFTNAYAPEVAADLGNWLEDDKSLKLGKKDAARLAALVESFRKSRKDGADAYAKLIKDLAD